MADHTETILETVARLLAALPPAGSTGARRGIEVAAAVIGRAETEAMRHAAALARSGVDAMPLLDSAAYKAMSESGGGESDVLWTIWTLSRASAHVSSMLADDASADLVAVSALLDAAHATLSGHKYDRLGRGEMSDVCYGRAAADAATASTILGDLAAGRDAIG